MDITHTIQSLLSASSDLILQRLGARERIISLARSLITTLETPSERIFRLAFAEPAGFALLRTAIDLSIFSILRHANGAAVAVAALAAPKEADPVFVHRMLRHLAAMDVVKETAAGEYASTAFSDALTEDRYRGGIVYTYDVLGPSLRDLPAFMAETGYKNPFDPAGGPFQHAHGTREPFFAWLAGHPEYMTAFNQYMGGYRAGKASWLDAGGVFPVEEMLRLDGTAERENRVVIVDVGGGMGQDLLELRMKHPDVKGRMILQDLPAVIDQIKDLPEEIEATTHDFFEVQPVKSARIYYLHSVLHDWDDASCISILQNIRPAMRPGYSKILINDFVIPNSGAVWAATAMDIGMMALGSVKERTEEDWKRLVDGAGLRISKVWEVERGSESIIEVVLGNENGNGAGMRE